MRSGRRRAGVAVLVAGTIAWLLAGGLFVLVLVAHQVEGDLVFCGDQPVGSSNYGHASWQWWYPGTRCAYDASDSTSSSVTLPPVVNGAIAAGLLAWPIVIALGVRRLDLSSRARRNRSQSDAENADDHDLRPQY